MKKIQVCLLVVVMLLTQITLADVVHQQGEVIGNILSTDIQASICGYLIPSYNIDNKLAVYAKNLRNYGFSVEWLPELREVHIKRVGGQRFTPMSFESYPYKGIGEKIGDVLYTDIRAFIDGEEIPSFNINGSTAIHFTSLERNTVGHVLYQESKRKANLLMGIDLNYSDIIAELQQYQDNFDTVFTFDSFYANNNQSIEEEGIKKITEYKETAKNIIEVANNLNTSMEKDFKNKYLYNRMPGTGRDYETEVDQLMQEVTDNSVVKYAYFITDESLVYNSKDAETRVRGRYVFQYQEPTKESYLKGLGYKNYRWYYQDVEVCIGFFFSRDLYKWEHSQYTFDKIINLTDVKELKVIQ